MSNERGLTFRDLNEKRVEINRHAGNILVWVSGGYGFLPR